jgi:hypothetical protein
VTLIPRQQLSEHTLAATNSFIVCLCMLFLRNEINKRLHIFLVYKKKKVAYEISLLSVSLCITPKLPKARTLELQYHKTYMLHVLCDALKLKWSSQINTLKMSIPRDQPGN